MGGAPLYARVLRERWDQVAAPVRCVHSTHAVVRARGQFRVEHGRHRLVPALARLLRLPPAADATDTRLTITAIGDGERWERTFGGHRLETRQYATDADELAERFGAIELRFRLHARDERLHYVQHDAELRWRSVRCRIPARLAPRVEAYEAADGPRRIRAHVEVTLPVVGLLIRYDGSIEVEDTRA